MDLVPVFVLDLVLSWTLSCPCLQLAMLLTFFSTCSSLQLGLLFYSSARVHPCCWEYSFHPLWVRSSGFLSPESSNPAMFTHTAGFSLSCVRSPASLLASVSVSPCERRTHTTCEALVSLRTYVVSRNPSLVHVLANVFDSACSLTCCSWSGSPQPHRHTPPRCACIGFPELGCSGSSSFSAWSWTPPCRVCGHSCASPGTPRRWSLCLEGLLSAPFVRLCSAWFPAIVHCGPPSAHSLTCGLLDCPATL